MANSKMRQVQSSLKATRRLIDVVSKRLLPEQPQRAELVAMLRDVDTAVLFFVQMIRESEARRLHIARSLGLRSDAGWAKIEKHIDEQRTSTPEVIARVFDAPWQRPTEPRGSVPVKKKATKRR